MVYATTTYLAIAAVAAVASSGYAAYSSYQQGKAQQQLDQYNAAIAAQNSQTASRDALIQANAQRAQNQRILAKQHAAFAANGAVADVGSPLLVEGEQAGYLERGALEVERTGNVRAGQYAQQAALDRMAGASAFTAGKLNAGASILQGVGSLANMGVNANYNGAFSKTSDGG